MEILHFRGAAIALRPQNLRRRLESVDPAQQAWFHHLKSLDGRNGVLDQYKYCLEELAEILRNLSPRSGKSLRLAFAWKRDKSKIEETFQRIERCKNSIQLEFLNDQR